MDYIDQEIVTKEEAETQLRRVLAYARTQAAEHRVSDPVWGRAASLIATHTEDALRVLILPVP